MKFLVVGIDYFIKWVEVKPLAKITQQNGRQFDNTPFREFCEQLGIRNHYFSPENPKVNRQTEVANQSLLKIIKTRLEGAKGIWPDELPNVLWAYRTTIRTPTRESHFKLAYRSDAVIPTKVGLSSYRVAHYNNDKNENQLHLSLDLIDKVRMDAKQRVAHYKNLMTKHHDALVKPRQFNIEDLILKRVSLATKDPAHGKLGPNWEGSYRVINSKRRGSYYLEALDE